MRLLVTGSRNWEGGLAEYNLGQVLNRFLDLAEILNVQLRIVNGACPTGADAASRRWADRRGIPVYEFPADWLKLGKRAGPIRNQHMVNSGVDICVAFLRDNSRGTQNTIDLARAAGIPTFVIPWPELSWGDPPNPSPRIGL